MFGDRRTAAHDPIKVGIGAGEGEGEDEGEEEGQDHRVQIRVTGGSMAVLEEETDVLGVNRDHDDCRVSDDLLASINVYP